jgi:hypothetical protein
MDDKQIRLSLCKPFAAGDIEWRVQRSGFKSGKPWAMVLCYVTNRAIQKRLDDVFGVFGWKNEYRDIGNGGVECGISIKHEGEWITKWDAAQETNANCSLDGSLKHRAKGKDGNQDKSFSWSEPTLPAWALPKEIKK